MKKMVTVRELKEYCAANKPTSIHFSSENQNWYVASEPCKFDVSFHDISVYENPNTVYLRSEKNIIKNAIIFDRIKFAEIDTETTVLGTILTLYCGNNGSNITFRLVVV